MTQHRPRETSREEAMGVLRGDREQSGVVRVDMGSHAGDFARTKHGKIIADLWVAAINERRVMAVSEQQVDDAIVMADDRARDRDGPALQLVPQSETTFDDFSEVADE